MARRHDASKRRIFLLCLVFMLSAGAWVVYKLVMGDLETADQFGGASAFLLALILAYPALRSWLWPSQPKAIDEHTETTQAQRELSELVRENSRTEKSKWGVDDPRPLAVHWHVVSDTNAVVHKTSVSDTTGETQYEDLAAHGTFSTVEEFYRSIPSQRMVIQGGPGSGKTVLAHHLITTLLDEPTGEQPVPVLFSVNTWNPHNTGLPRWLADQLCRDYPHLSGEHPTDRTLATVLVRRERILPVLDGFDEIPEQFRVDALEAISRFDGPLIVTTRRDEYAAATGKARAIGKADAIALDPPSLDDVQRYLHDSTGTTQARAWTHVFDRLHTENDPAYRELAAVLSVPLMVTLARTVYRTTDHGTPTDLLDISRFGGRNGLEEHLLGRYIDTVYDPRHTFYDDSTEHPPWTPDQARRWLGYLAHHLTQRDTHDLAWWRLGTTFPWYTRILTTMSTAGLVNCLATGFTVWLMLRGAPGYLYGLGAVLLSDGLTMGLPLGLAAGLVAGLVNEVRIARNGAVRDPERLRLHLRNIERAGRRTDIKRLPAEFTTGFAFGLAVGLTYELTVGLVNALTNRQEGFPSLTTSFVVAFLLGFANGLMNVLVAALGDSNDSRESIHPWTFFSTDRAVTLIRASTVTIAVILTDRLTYGLDSLLTLGIPLVLANLLLSSWGNWLVVARLRLPLTRRLPWRPKLFLEDAHRRGVFRQAGVVYQFRHARLRDHLARESSQNRPIHDVLPTDPDLPRDAQGNVLPSSRAPGRFRMR